MIRRSLLFALSLVLVLVFAFLAVRGCQQGKEPMNQPADIMEESKTTATRVLQPKDLEVANSKVFWASNAGKPLSTEHEIDIHNQGKVTYRQIQLRFNYVGYSGQVIETRNFGVSEAIPPGGTLKLTKVRMDGLSKPAQRVHVSIVSADIDIGDRLGGKSN